MAAKPAKYPRCGDVPNVGGIVEPPESGTTVTSKDVGVIPGTRTPAPFMVWWLNLIYQWTLYLGDIQNQSFTTGGTAGGPWTGAHSFRNSVDIDAVAPFSSLAHAGSGSDGVIGTGDGAGYGGTFTGGATGGGVHAIGNGAAPGILSTGFTGTGNGGNFFGGSGGNTYGVLCTGHGTGPGVGGTGGATGWGGFFIGGASGGGVLGAAGSTGNGAGGSFTGHGTGDGVTAQGGATGCGITATGGATGTAGILATAQGTGSGGFFTSGTSPNFGGCVGLAASGSNSPGVFGVGDGNDVGVLGTGGNTGSGVKGNGGGSAAGVEGAGGSSSGPGVKGTGGAGGVGVQGIGGTGNTAGGSFTGTGSGAGVSCAGGATGPGCNATSSTASVAAVKAAGSAAVSKGVEITAGALVLSGSSPAAGTNPGFDGALYAENIIHAKGEVSLSGGGGGGSWDGFNVDPASVTFTSSNTVIHVTWTRPIPGTVVPVPSSSFGLINVISASSTGASFRVSDTTGLAGSTFVDLVNGGIAITIRFIVS